jgi:hypothetical protein
MQRIDHALQYGIGALSVEDLEKLRQNQNQLQFGANLVPKHPDTP